MKAILMTGVVAILLSGCNAMTATADRVMDKQSSFSQEPTTIYPTVDGTKEGETAQFGKQQF